MDGAAVTGARQGHGGGRRLGLQPARARGLARTRTRVMEAELRALRAQISPHFIYNGLAAIASFVRTDPDRARELLIDFAGFTRYALRSGGAFDAGRRAAQRRALPHPRTGPLRRPAPDLVAHRAKKCYR